MSSEPGVGTTFRIYLPRFLADGIPAQEQAEQRRAAAGKARLCFSWRTRRRSSSLGRHMLEGLGYTVLTAGSPSEAIRLAG